ncbi:antibiotic biosynthesis monooxygenase [Rosenbergiella sp. S61]|uniref:Antibiotic biosynthesis monooxygenase n=1 Tax=Rosenbergiella gaditana TaxID=2726987 RepID=A0ABS5SYZ5_9GAMM|nr:antibiotic biosynthesis monooxygenase [Rosenbergiella gaditana]MBT0725333.1 antibiotic biosynthesis monooxygenase [Rosenbergiella gaditana]
MIAVLFEADTQPEAETRYFELASELKPLLNTIPGFIDIERFQSLRTQGKILSLSWWEDEKSIAIWKQNMAHASAQKEGKEDIFSYYRIRVAKVLRDYSSKKENE